MEKYIKQAIEAQTRRAFLRNMTAGVGSLALGQMLGGSGMAAASELVDSGPRRGILGSGHFPAKAKRVIFLFQAGGPSQMELFDHKPVLKERHGEEIPPSVMGQHRVSGMVTAQSTFPLVQSVFDFKQHGDSGAWISELLPHTASIADDLCFIKSMHTDQINHEPAVMMLQTGFQLAGRPSIGSWVSDGLGSDNENMPSFVVLTSKGKNAQPLNEASWGSGWLPSEHQGIRFRGGKDPVLYLNNPDGLTMDGRRAELDAVADLNRLQNDHWQDPTISSKISQYEMAYRMQMSIPDAADVGSEPDHVLDMYGDDVRTPGTFAANCLLARRLAERNVKFIQLYHTGWDMHGNLPGAIRNQAMDTDQAAAALVKDLKQRGMLEDTLVIWGGEFGRTAFSQGQLTATNYGRDHHKGAFTYWMAGAGVKAGYTHGETDDFSYNIVKDAVHVHDFQATLMHLMGVDHERLTYKYQGRRFRLTEVHGKVVKDILA